MNQRNQVSNYDKVSHALKSDQTINRLTLALGFGADNKAGKQEAFKYASSVLMEVERSVGTDSDLTGCNPTSIVQSMIDAARLKIFIDSRQHAHLVAFGKRVSLMIGYRGYIHKIKDHFDDVDFHYGHISKGDTFTMNSENGSDFYNHKRANPLNDNYDDIEGVFCAISYTVAGQRVQKVTMMSKAMIDRVKDVAKTKFVWNKWYIEKAIAAVIKRACKVNFASIKEVNEIIRYDNENNFVPYNDQKPKVKASNPFETMNKVSQESQNKEAGEPSNDIEGDYEVKDTPSTQEGDLFHDKATIQIRDAIYIEVENISDKESYDNFMIKFEDDIEDLQDHDKTNVKQKLENIKRGLEIE